MKAEGKVQVVVRSRKVPIGTGYHTAPFYSLSGVRVASRASRFVVYGTSLDGEQLRAIDEGQRLACNLGLELEVVDESRSGRLRRMLSYLGVNVSRGADFVVSPSAHPWTQSPRAVPQGR